MAPLDDAIAKLEAFDQMILRATGSTGMQAVLVTERKTALSGELATLDTLLTSFDGDLDTALEAVGEAADGAAKELAELEKTARSLADDRLAAVAKSVEDGGATFLKDAAALAQRLRDACAQAESDGFDAARGGLWSAEQTLDAATESSTEILTELVRKARETGRRFTDAVKDAFDAAREVTPDAVGAADEIKRVGEAVEAALAAHASAAAGKLGEPRQQATSFHEELLETGARSGEEILTEIGTALAELSSLVGEIDDSALAVFPILVAEIFPAHAAELGAWAETIFEARGAAWEFPAAAGELRQALVTAGTVAGILANAQQG